MDSIQYMLRGQFELTEIIETPELINRGVKLWTT